MSLRAPKLLLVIIRVNVIQRVVATLLHHTVELLGIDHVVPIPVSFLNHFLQSCKRNQQMERNTGQKRMAEGSRQLAEVGDSRQKPNPEADACGKKTKTRMGRRIGGGDQQAQPRVEHT